MTRVAGAIIADLEATPLGTRGRLADELAGIPVLRRTVQRVLRARRLSGLTVLVPRSQERRARAVLDALPVDVRNHDTPPVPWGHLVRHARKWSLDGWRGGIGGTTSLDEYMYPALLDAWLSGGGCDAVMVIPPAAVVIVPELIDAMIEHHGSVHDESRITFTQAPPGVTGAIFDVALIQELAAKNIPPGWILSYKPDAPRKDLAFFPCCYQVPAVLTHARGRLIADTDRAVERVGALLADHPDPDDQTIGRWLSARDECFVPARPVEVEIELTTDDPFPDCVLRPRGARVGRRGPIDPRIVDAVASELARDDDALVVLGGFGDPVRHPQFDAILGSVRAAGVYGLALRTCGVDLTEARLHAIFESGVDVVTLLVDGWTPETYAAMSAPNDPSSASLSNVTAGIERIEALRGERRCAYPIVVPEMVKARQTVDELADFFDGWIRKVGTVNITGYSHRAGQLDDHAVMSMAPAARSPCRRIRSRCLVLADGRVAACDQDFRGSCTVGRLGERTLSDIWNGPRMNAARDAHAGGRFAEAFPPCSPCDEWHRP